jgi:hypothetical protein
VVCLQYVTCCRQGLQVGKVVNFEEPVRSIINYGAPLDNRLIRHNVNLLSTSSIVLLLNG